MAAERLRVEPAEGEGDGRSIEALVASGQHREALAACARAYALPLGRLCMAFTGSQAESEELVQETLLAAFDAFPQYRGEGSVRAFLFGIARRLCGRHVEMRPGARRGSGWCTTRGAAGTPATSGWSGSGRSGRATRSRS